MIKTILLDDEPLALQKLEMYARKVPFLEVFASCASATAARDFVSGADAIFLDINMPDVNGLDFIRSLEKPPLVVFTTAYPEFALEGFKVDAVDYLLKPFSLAEFIRAAEKVRELFELRQNASAPEVFYFRSDRKTVAVPLSDILYVESMSEYIKVYRKSVAEPLVVLYGLGRLAEELPSLRFLRIHRSYIVALDAITEAGSASVTLCAPPAAPVALPVGDLFRPALRSWLLSR